MGHKGVGAHLMLWTNPLHIQYFRELVQAAMKIVAKLHEVFYVKDVGEVDLQATSTINPCWSITSTA